jgi:hypothetical protein
VLARQHADDAGIGEPFAGDQLKRYMVAHGQGVFFVFAFGEAARSGAGKSFSRAGVHGKEPTVGFNHQASLCH